MTEHEIVAYVLAHPYVEPDHDTNNVGDRGDGDSDGGGHGEPGGAAGGPGGPPAGDDGPTSGAHDARTRGRPTDDGAGNHAPGDNTHGQPSGDSHGRSAPGDSTHGQPAGDGSSNGAPEGGTRGRPAASDEAASTEEAAETPSSASAPIAAPSPTRWAAPEVRVELATLLGINEHPAQIPPWGYVPAALVRHLVADMNAAHWRYVVCDPAGRASHGGLIHARPATGSGQPVRRDSRRGGIIEIAVAAGELGSIAATQPTNSRWKPVLVELARNAETRGADPDTDPNNTTRRTPASALRRWIQLRDRQCVHPCCRAPARTTDQDHRVGYAQGGATIGVNLSTPCRHDHRLKDEGHWAIHQPEPALTIWTSPLGHQYQSRRPPVIPTAPEPYPDDERRLDEPVKPYIWTNRPEPCQCDAPCNCEPQTLPPAPTRAPRNEPEPDPKPTVIFDPDQDFPF